MLNQKKPNYKRFRIIKSVGILAAFLMLVPLLEIYSYNTAYSSISPSSIYDSIQKKFDNLLPFEVPQLDNEENIDNPLPYKVSPQGEKIPLELPPLDEDFPFKVPQLDEQGKKDSLSNDDTESQSVQTAAITPCTASLNDNFVGQYFLGEGQTSPNGKWKNVYSGYGSTGVKHNYDGRNAFWLYPQTSTSPSVTHAAFVKSTDKFCNFSMNFDINTVNQMRKNSPANTWEVGWIFFRYVDDTHHYYLLVKPNGIELERKIATAAYIPEKAIRYT